MGADRDADEAVEAFEPATTPVAAAEAEAQTLVMILGKHHSPLSPRALLLVAAALPALWVAAVPLL